MTKLKLGPIADDKPVKATVELPAPLHTIFLRHRMVAGIVGTAAEPIRPGLCL